MEEEHWSDWIEHDGKGCPYPVGTVIHVYYLKTSRITPTGEEVFTLGLKGGGKSWWYKSLDRKDWSDNPDIPGNKYIPIIRYRVKKPKGLTILEGILNKVGQGDCVPRLLEKM